MAFTAFPLFPLITPIQKLMDVGQFQAENSRPQFVLWAGQEAVSGFSKFQVVRQGSGTTVV